MKIAWVSHGASLEGAEQCLIEAVKGLSEKGQEVHVIVPSDGKLVSILEGIVASVRVVPHPWWVNEFKGDLHPIKRIFYYLRATLSLIKILKQMEPQLVVTNTIVIPCGAFASKLLGIPHVWYIHEFLEEDHGWTFEFGRRLSLFFVSWLSKIVIVNSNAVYERFKRDIHEAKMKVVYYAVENSQEKGVDTSAKLAKNKNSNVFYVTLVGRKAPGKRQEDAVKSLSILINKGLSIHLWLVGSDFGDYTNYLRELAQELGISDRVDFISFVDHPSLYMKFADLTLMCSRCEAFGRVTIEAMKQGKAVIGADSGATSELIQDGWNGLLYQACSASALAEKIEVLYTNRQLRKEIEINAYKWANETFNMEKYTSNLLSVFKSVVKDASVSKY